MRNRLLAIMLWLTTAAPALAAAAGVSQNIQLGAQMVMGMQSQYPNTLFQYQEPVTTTAQFQGSTIVSVPANTTNNQINTATLFPGCVTPVAIGVQEMTNPGLQVNVGLSSSDTRLQIAPGGFILLRLNGGFPTFYVDNPSVSSPALVRVFILSN